MVSFFDLLAFSALSVSFFPHYDKLKQKALFIWSTELWFRCPPRVNILLKINVFPGFFTTNLFSLPFLDDKYFLYFFHDWKSLFITFQNNFWLLNSKVPIYSFYLIMHFNTNPFSYNVTSHRSSTHQLYQPTMAHILFQLYGNVWLQRVEIDSHRRKT